MWHILKDMIKEKINKYQLFYQPSSPLALLGNYFSKANIVLCYLQISQEECGKSVNENVKTW